MFWPLSCLSSKKPIFLGLDISSSAVKSVELERLNDTVHVKKVGHYALTSNVMDGHLVQDVEGLSEGIQQLLNALGYSRPSYRCMNVVIAVPDSCTLSKTIAVSDRLEDHDLEELVRIELDKFMPQGNNDIFFDFKQVGTSLTHAHLKELLIIATRMQHVQHRVEALRQLGLRVSVVDIESHAIQRVLPFLLHQGEEDSITVVLDLGAQYFKAFFFKNKSLVFMQEEALRSSYEDIHPQPDLVYVESLLIRIKRAFQFFYSAHSANVPIQQIVVAGGGAQQTDLCRLLDAHLRCATVIANPFSNMIINHTMSIDSVMNQASRYLTACGLALRA